MISYLGDFAEDTTVYIMFNTFTSNDPSASCTITNFVNTDVHIHKDDGLTQRNNAAGITVSVDFDGITGSHMIKIDTSDNTVAGFWVVGHEYFVRIEGTTIDGATINSVVGQFSIENRHNEVDVVKWLGQACAAVTVNGVPEVDATHLAGVAQSLTDLKHFADQCYSPASFCVQSSIQAIQGDNGSATDLKDFVDAGYDPATNKIQGVVLVDEVTTLAATAADLILKDSTFALAIADAIWDEILTGATHNIATSAGRRVREIGAFAIHGGTAQAGNTIHITLAATASAVDGIYNRNLLVIVGGTGAGQTRTIVDYDGATKIALADREWRVSPDATSEYQITPDDTPLTVDHGSVQAATNTTITIRDYASSIDNTYLCNIVVILAGTGRGQARLVSSYNGTTNVITICGDDWVTTPDTSSVYALIPYGASCVGCLADAALAQINTECDTALTDYDSPTRTEATSDKDELIASLDTIKGTGWIQTSHSLAERPVGGNGGGGGTCSWWDADVELAINFFKSFQLRFDEIMLNFDKISSNIAEIDSDTSVNDSIVSSNESTASEIVSVKNSVKLLSNEIRTLSKELKTTDSLLISMADAPSLEDLLDE